MLFTLETDKVSTEIVAEKAGLLETSVPEGQEVKIGQVVATIDDSKTGAAAGKSDAKPAAAKPAEGKSPGGDQALSPSVRRIVEEEHLEPSRISGTGKDGRLTKADVLGAAQNKAPAGDTAGAPRKPAASPADSEERTTPSDDGRVVRRKMSPLRRKIAAQLVMAQHNAAILTTFNECDMSAVQKLRADSQEAFHLE